MRLPILMVCLSLLLAPAPASAALQACANATEQQAMHVRAFQSYLMVAGVACNQAPAYNKFMTRYQAVISNHGLNLKSYFSRAYSTGSEKKMNDFITDLANAWSQIHMKSMSSYCKTTWDTMWYLDREPAASANAKLLALAQKINAAQATVIDTLCSNNGVSAVVAQAAATPTTKPR